MAYPKRQRGVRACVAVGKDGVTLYGNKATFRSLAKWMTWIAESKPSEHYECHVVWHLLSRVAKRTNVFVRFDDSGDRAEPRGRKGRGQAKAASHGFKSPHQRALPPSPQHRTRSTRYRPRLTAAQIETALIDPGKPWQNGADESFNGKFRDEFLTLQ
jgi:hypothetical protein